MTRRALGWRLGGSFGQDHIRCGRWCRRLGQYIQQALLGREVFLGGRDLVRGGAKVLLFELGDLPFRQLDTLKELGNDAVSFLQGGWLGRL
jgi:hypothetical protein